MKKSRFTDEQIIGFLKQVEGGVPVKDLCRKHGFSDATFYKWRSRLGGLDVSEVRRLRELESERKLPRPLAGRCEALDHRDTTRQQAPDTEATRSKLNAVARSMSSLRNRPVRTVSLTR
jgi:putative transposase